MKTKKTLAERKKIASMNNPMSEVNEIAFGHYALGGTWEGFDDLLEVKTTYEKAKDTIGARQTSDQQGRAKAMSEELFRSRGAKRPIKAWWIARKRNQDTPADVVLEYEDGEQLGVSCKSTSKKSGDIAFKNPGIGSLAKALDIDLASLVSQEEERVVAELDLPWSKKERKSYIRANLSIREETMKSGKRILNRLRDKLLVTYQSMTNEELREHLKSTWLDAQNTELPYIKITGRGADGDYSASIHDPTKNDKVRALSSEDSQITMASVGNDSIGVSVGPLRIMKIRFKYESEKLASTIKLSGDPW